MALTDHPQIGQEPHSGDTPPPLTHQHADDHDQDDVHGMMMQGDTAVIDGSSADFSAKDTVAYGKDELADAIAQAKAEVAQDSQKTTKMEVDQETNPFTEAENQDPVKKKRWLKIGATAVAVLAVGAGAFSVGKSSSASKTAPTAVTSTLAPPVAPESISDNIPDTSEAPATTTGLNPGEIIKGDSILEVARPTGEVIKVPGLRDPKNHSANEVVASFLGLTDCWGTTHNQGCLDAISPDAGVQKAVTDLVAHVEENFKTTNNMKSLPEDYQLVTFDSSKTPAQFDMQSTGSTQRLSLASGTAQLNPFISPSGESLPWHDASAKQESYSFGYKMDRNFSLELATGSDGQPYVKNLTWSYSRN